MDKTRKRRLIPFQNWSKLLGHWFKFESGKQRRSMSTKATSAFKYPEVAETLSTIHDTYVVVPADKAPNNFVLICKKNYIDFLIN